MSNEEGISKDGERAIKSVAKGGGIVFVGLIIARLLGYFYRMIIARYLGPSEYGLISLGLAVLGFSMPFASLGIHSGLKRFASFYLGKKQYQRVKGTIFSSIKIMTFSSIIVTVLIFFSADFIAVNIFHNSSVSIIIKILALSIPLKSLLEAIKSSIQSFKEMKYNVLSGYIFRDVSKVSFTVVLLFAGLGVLGAAYAYVIAFSIALISGFYFLKRKILPRLGKNIKHTPNYGEILRYSWPLLLTGLLGSIMGWTDSFMLGYFKSAAQVGIYNAALPTALFLMIFLRAINEIIFPVMSDLLSKDKIEEIRNIYKTATKWVFSLTFPAFLLLTFFSRQILYLLFGKEYVSGAAVLSILGFAYFLNTAVGPTDKILKTLGKTKIILLNKILAGSVNIILNLFLIPKFGILGAAIATGTSIVILQVLMVVENYYFLKIQPYKLSLIRPVFAAVISASTTYLIFDPFFTLAKIWMLLPAFLVFAAFYTFLFLIFRSLDEEDIMILRSVERKTGIRIKWLRNLIKKFI